MSDFADLANRIDTATIAATGAILSSGIAGVSALILGIANLLGGRANQRELEKLRDKLVQRGRDRDAARDYEYSARKRLYTQCEPAIFRFLENCDAAKARIERLAKIEKESLGGLSKWIQDDENRLSTIYRLFAPIADFSIMRELLTSFDLSLEPRIYAHYALGRILYESFSDDYTLARCKPSQSYIPNEMQGAQQGVPQETIDQVCGILTTEIDGIRGLFPFHRLREAVEVDDLTRDVILKVDYLLRGFTPSSRPVLWRVLSVQHYIYEKLDRSTNILEPKTGKFLLSTMENSAIFTGNTGLDADTLSARNDFLERRLERVSNSLRAMKFVVSNV